MSNFAVDTERVMNGFKVSTNVALGVTTTTTLAKARRLILDWSKGGIPMGALSLFRKRMVDLGMFLAWWGDVRILDIYEHNCASTTTTTTTIHVGE